MGGAAGTNRGVELIASTKNIAGRGAVWQAVRSHIFGQQGIVRFPGQEDSNMIFEFRNPIDSNGYMVEGILCLVSVGPGSSLSPSHGRSLKRRRSLKPMNRHLLL